MIDQVTINDIQEQVTFTEQVADQVVVVEAQAEAVVIVEQAADSVAVADSPDSVVLVEQAADTVIIAEAGGDSVVVQEPGTSDGSGAGEIDPVFLASAAYGISPQDLVNWDNAFGWGNHAGLYPLLTGAYQNPDWIYSLAWGKITGAPAFLQATDLQNYYTKTQLQTSGQSQVHWGNLTNVPELTVDLSAYYTKTESDGNYIRNQNVGQQAANGWINGAFRVGVLGVGEASVAPSQYGLFSMGWTSPYAWMQSWAGSAIAINPLGNNVLIGTTTDAGYKLDVNGSGRFYNTTNDHFFILERSANTANGALTFRTGGTNSYLFGVKALTSHVSLYSYSTGADLVTIGSTYTLDVAGTGRFSGGLTSPNTSYAGSERFGASAVATNAGGLAIGSNAGVVDGTSGRYGGTAIGTEAVAHGGSLAIGYNAHALNWSMAVGTGAYADFLGTALGNNANAAAYTVAIGQEAVATTAWQVVLGGGLYAYTLKITDIPNLTTDPDKILVSDSGVVKYMTKAQLGIGATISQPANQIVYGTGSGVTSNTLFRYTSLGQLLVGYETATVADSSYKLQIAGAAYFGGSGIVISYGGTGTTGTTRAIFGTSLNTDLALYANNTNYATLTADGKLLVGYTTAPIASAGYLLQVNGAAYFSAGSTGSGFAITSSGSSVQIGTLANYGFDLLTNGTAKASLTNDGKFLIGYTASQGAYALQVNGSAYVSGGSYTAGSVYASTALDSVVVIGNTVAPASTMYKFQVDGNAYASGDYEVGASTQGVVLKSPDGTRYRVQVANGGSLTVTAV